MSGVFLAEAGATLFFVLQVSNPACQPFQTKEPKAITPLTDLGVPEKKGNAVALSILPNNVEGGRLKTTPSALTKATDLSVEVFELEDIFSNLPKFKNSQYQLVPLIHEWARAYEVPEVAIIRQLYVAHAWINANPRKAPKRDVVRFLFNWMRKAKEYGNLRVPQAIPKPEPEKEGDMTVEEMIAIREQNMGKRRTSA